MWARFLALFHPFFLSARVCNAVYAIKLCGCMLVVRTRDWVDFCVILCMCLYVFYVCKFDSVADLICNQWHSWICSQQKHEQIPCFSRSCSVKWMCSRKSLKWLRQDSLIKTQIMFNTLVLVLLALLRCVINLWSRWVLNNAVFKLLPEVEPNTHIHICDNGRC